MITDPDLGRDRATRALGRRDWRWFDAAQREPAGEPWGTTRHVTAHDRHDRTLGIPERAISMWPDQPTELIADPTPAGRAESICDELLTASTDAWPWPPLGVAVAALTDIAQAVAGRDPAAQYALIAATARRHQLDPGACRDLAVGVGSLVARTTHQPAATTAGAASLNILAAARIIPATRLFLAREQARRAETRSDPDLPRLWLLANGLTHGVPAPVLRRVPARSAGPAARIVPTHDDLVAWDGIGDAVTHLRHTVTAAAAGRQWLSTHPPGSTDELALAVGVIALTDPAAAARLARHGPGRLRQLNLPDAAGPAPRCLLDLSDAALKAVCDRAGWLLGSPAERTMRELAERRGPLSDQALDTAAYRKNPPAGDVTAAQRLVREAGREALRRFAGIDPPQRPSFAEAIAHRFPGRAAATELRHPQPDALLASPPAPAAGPVAQTLDLGL